MSDRPFVIEVLPHGGFINPLDNHIVRHLSAMKDQFLDNEAYEVMLKAEDVIVYEVYETKRPEVPGELLNGISVVHPGKVGDEFFMTKGHFHTELETAEIYYCLQGNGMMVMETPEGEWAVEPLVPRNMVYVSPRWAHRSVNTSLEEDLVMFFVYPGNAGHDYRSIERQGFRKIIVERDGQTAIVDNPRWVSPEER